MEETRLRSVVKAVCFRAIATLTTMVLVFAFTRRISFALGIGALEVVSKLLLYYWHERLWNVVRWGKVRARDESAGKGRVPMPSSQDGLRSQPAVAIASKNAIEPMRTMDENGAALPEA